MAASLRTAAFAPFASAWDEFLTLFSNVLFAVSLFAVWGLLTLIGVIVDQGKEQAAYWAEYSAPVARLILRLHLDNIYHSPAYVGIIGLILTSLAVCTFKRVIPARIPRLRPVVIEHSPLHATLEVAGDEAAVSAGVDAALRARGWHIRKKEFGGVEWTFADRHNWARRGVLVAHAGFVIIAAGTSLYWATGFSGERAILAGETVAIARSGASITLQSFRDRFEPIATKSGIVYQPIDYVSNVRVRGRDGSSRDATIRVNAPIDIDGTLYYQAGFGYAARFALTQFHKPIAGLPPVLLKEGQGFTIPGTSRSIQYGQFAGTIDRKNNTVGRDPRPNDPGAVLTFFDGDAELGKALVPFGSKLDLGSGYALAPLSYTVYTGLQYRYDPGIPLVGIGAFVLLAGLCISFYLLPARLFVRIGGEAGRRTVGIAATTVKGYDIFEAEFRALVAALEARTLGE